MTERLFGTDGIRGRVNQGAIRPANFVRFGEALGYVLREQASDMPRVLVGRDTRQSGLMIEAAITSGLLNAGIAVESCGFLPPPGVGFLTKKHGYSVGLMITASHNPAADNGVKVFNADGFKLSSDIQRRIEELIGNGEPCFVDVANMGHISDAGLLQEEYISFAQDSIGTVLTLDGMTVCVDGANGAGCQIVETVLTTLGATVIMLGNEPNGHNINLDCGALHPEKLSLAVRANSADIGLALDGDADRLIFVDEAGAVIDGDQIMGAIGIDFKIHGQLKGGALVATIMSNLGLEGALRLHDIGLERTAVGDRYVVERMRAGGFNVGGEQSGHIVLADYVTTGDAIIAALQILKIMKRDDKPASEVLSVFDPVPQFLKNVRYTTVDPLSEPNIQSVIKEATSELGSNGRIVIRKSGTEPLIRVMVEAFENAAAERTVDYLVSEIELAVSRSA